MGFKALPEVRQSNDKPWDSRHCQRNSNGDVQTTAQQDKSTAESSILPVHSRQDRWMAMAEDNQDNDRKYNHPSHGEWQWWKTIKTMIGSPTIQVTLVRHGRTTVWRGHAGSSQQHQHGVQRSQTNVSSVSQTVSRNYPSYVCIRLWGLIIPPTGFSKTSPTFSLLQLVQWQPSTTARCYVPPSWKQAEILPIPKTSQVTSLAKHLRPIALTPVLSKVLECFVMSWMRRATVHRENLA